MMAKIKEDKIMGIDSIKDSKMIILNILDFS